MKIKVILFLVSALIIFPINSDCKTTDTNMVKMSRIKKSAVSEKVSSANQSYQLYIDYFEQVFDLMEKNYYQPVSRERLNEFIEVFKSKIYNQLNETGRSVDYVKWRSAALLVDRLKAEEDIFSGFYPPKPAQEFETIALGKKIDLGIEGQKNDHGYEVTFIEPRSDPYVKGLRVKDLILSFEGQSVFNLDEVKIQEFLNPLESAEVKIDYRAASDHQERSIKVKSQEYFKQTVFPFNTGVAGIFGLKLDKFNRMTSEDMLRYLQMFRSQGNMRGLIIDLRDNPGGPPLAAREISSFFLPGGEQFAYFHKKGMPEAKLDVPAIPERFKYNGPMVLWMNKKTGSAAEFFCGSLQKKQRAVLGGSPSAGQVMLKSMFDLDDKSMLLLITSRGHYPDGSTFSFDGLVPDIAVQDQAELLFKTNTYLLKYMESHGQ